MKSHSIPNTCAIPPPAWLSGKQIDGIGLYYQAKVMENSLETHEAETDEDVGEVPQGGVFSPLFWSMMVNGLLPRLTGLGITVNSYAEDIVSCGSG